MRKSDLQFLAALAEAPSPSGFEQPAARVFREWVTGHADAVETNVMGSVHALLKGKGGKRRAPSVMLAGHIDEVGMMVNYVTPEGFVAFKAIGGVDAAILPGVRVDVHAKGGALRGVVGRLPVHLIDEEQRKSVTKLEKLFIDLGTAVDRVKERVRVGDPITYAVGFETFGEGMAVCRAFDDKMGAYVCGRVLAEVRRAGGAKGDLVAAATVQEELGLRGGITSAYGIDPDVGIAVEAGHATDYPDVDKRNHGEAACGAGPIIARGANINPAVFELLVQAAEKAKVAYQIGAEPRGTGTDANAIQLARGGKAAGLVSVPVRYMHTPTEVLALDDVEGAVKLLTRFVLDLAPGTDFTP